MSAVIEAPFVGHKITTADASVTSRSILFDGNYNDVSINILHWSSTVAFSRPTLVMDCAHLSHPIHLNVAVVY